MASLVTKVAATFRTNGLKAVVAKALRYLVRTMVCYIIALRGNKARMDGVLVHLDDTSISTGMKLLVANGEYEQAERLLLHKHFPHDVPIIELGACIGVLSCISNRKLTPKQHIVVEANPHLISILEKNRSANNCSFTIFQAAVGYDQSQVDFFIHNEPHSGSIHQASGKAVRVSTTSVQQLAESARVAEFNLICDIEGAEVDLFHHEAAYLGDHARLLLVEMHGNLVGETQISTAHAHLLQCGFELVDVVGNVHCYANHRAGSAALG